MTRSCLHVFLFILAAISAGAQPSFQGPPPSTTPVLEAAQRRSDYLRRVDEVLDWAAGGGNAKTDDPAKLDLAMIAARIVRGRDLPGCSQRVIEMMREPGTGPFWMFPSVCIAYLGRDRLSPEALASIRTAWRTTRQVRGDTENHFVMYYLSLYLMAELYPDEPAETWYSGKSSAENLAEARSFILHWIDQTTTVGQGEFNPTHYLGEYVIPLQFIANWSKDPGMRQRGRMMLDWLFAELAANTLHGVLRGPNSRSDEGSIIERWQAMASYFSWLLFGNTPPTAGYSGWGLYFAPLAANYELPEVIYRIATDRTGDFVQRDRARVRRFWRYSDELSPPVYKTNYLRRDYAVGSTRGGRIDPIQSHVWDVTWAEPDPRGKHPTMFSLHPHSSGEIFQASFTFYPEPMIKGVTFEGKPSYDSPDKIMGSSPYEQVFQDLDTVIALYAIPAGERFPQINGFFSKDLTDVSEDKSGWIFARGGHAYLAYRPLAGYHWEKYLHYSSGWAKDRLDLGGRLLVSPHLKNGTMVQAASASEFKDFAAFQAAITALPLTFKLEPGPTVALTTLRGKRVTFTYGQTPPLAGTFAWTNGDRSFAFHHDTPFDPTTNYTVRVLGTAQDAEGGTLDGDFDRTREGSPADDFVWTFRFPVPNDDFANAQLLAGTSGQIDGNNRYATWDVTEPQSVERGAQIRGNTVWYRWTPPESGGCFTFDLTKKSTFDSMLDIFAGDAIEQLTLLASNDNYGSQRGGRISFAPLPGTNYFVRVSGKNAFDPAQAGVFQLAWYATPPPVLTGVQMSPSQGAPGTRVVLTGTNFTGATAVLFNGANAPFSPTEGEFADLRLATYVPLEATSGPITIVTPHGNGTSAGLFTALPMDPTPPSIAQITALAASDQGKFTPILVRFDKPVELSSAQAIANYRIDNGGISISNAVLQPDLKTVLLIAAPLQEAENHRLEVNSIIHRFLPQSVSPTFSGTFQANTLVLEMNFETPTDRGANGTGHSKSGELVGQPSPVPGAVGSALHFDGIVDFVDVPHDPVFDITGDMTIAAWIRRDSFGKYSPVLAKAGDGGYLNAWDYDLYFPDWSDSLVYYSDGLQPNTVWSSETVANRNWNHVAVTRSGDRITFYINGRASGSATVAGALPARPYPVRIGTDGWNYSQGSLFEGQIDEVRLYNKALTADEIQALARPRLGIAFSSGNVVLSWPATGRAFRLEESVAPGNGAWNPVVQSPVVTNGQRSLVTPALTGTRFYRLVAN